MATATDHHEIVERVRAGIDRRGRWGIGLASTYLRQLERSFVEEGGGDWERTLKEAESKLTYCDPELEVDGLSVFVRRGSGWYERRLADDGQHIIQVKATKREPTPGAVMEFEAVVTSKRRDRDGDVLEPAGAEVDQAAPLLWQHMPSQPIGKLLEVTQQNSKRVKARFAIIDSALGRDAAALVDFGVLRISHGFLPIDWDEMTDKQGEFLGWHVTRYEMMEISLVSVPSNVDAVVTDAQMQRLTHPAVKAWAKSMVGRQSTSVSVAVPAETQWEIVSAEEPDDDKGTIPSNPSGGSGDGAEGTWRKLRLTDFTDESWDNLSSAEKRRIAKHFAWYASLDAFGDLKLGHHFADTGKPSLNGVRAALARANQVDGIGGDLDRVMTHLRAHLPERATRPGGLKVPTERWNRKLSKSFDVTAEYVQPSKLEYDWVARFIGCEVKDVFRTRVLIPAARMGSVLTGLRHVTADSKVHDVRNITGDGKEIPPHYEVVQLNSTKQDDFLVDGITFYAGPECKYVINLSPEYRGIHMTVYTSTDDKDFNRQLVDDAFAWAREHNFLKGESFSLSGEFIKKTDDGWGDVFLPSKNKAPSQRAVSRLNDKGKSCPNRGMIFMGPPGTGKTLSGRVVMNQAEATFIWVSSRDFYYWGAFGGIAHGFDLARELAPSVLFIEDVDNWMNDHTTDLLRTEMDGVARSSGLLTILTTNYPERLPEALIDRPGRFHDVLLFDLPDAKRREEMLRAWLPNATDGGRTKAVKGTDGYSGAHVFELCEYAKVIADEDGCHVDKAIGKALDKIAEQRDLIDQAQLAGSTYSPRRDADPQQKAAKCIAHVTVEATVPTYRECLAAAMNFTPLQRAHLAKVLQAINESEHAAILNSECRRILEG